MAWAARARAWAEMGEVSMTKKARINSLPNQPGWAIPIPIPIPIKASVVPRVEALVPACNRL